MKKINLLIIMIIILLISGCSQDSIETHSTAVTENEETTATESEENTATQGEMIPSQFHSEKELVKGVKKAKESKERFDKGHNDKLENRDYYYMPVNIPPGYEFHSITVVPDIFYSTYVEIGKEYAPFEVFDFGYYTIASGWTMENTIKGHGLVQSDYSSKLYFWYEDHLERYSYAFFELDNKVFYVRFPYEISLDNKDEVKMIEELCKMKKIKID